jgi:hypothetical protein
MSKASQRRLAQQQHRAQKRIKALDPIEHVTLLLRDALYEQNFGARWADVCARVNPDPFHPDRSKLTEWLMDVAWNMKPVLETLRFTANSAPSYFSNVDARIAEAFGGRLFHGNGLKGELSGEWFDVCEERSLNSGSMSDANTLKIILFDKLEKRQRSNPDMTFAACMFLAPEQDMPAILAGVSASGATACVVEASHARHVARSFAVAEAGFALAATMQTEADQIPGPTAFHFQNLATAIAGSDTIDLNAPSGRARTLFRATIQDSLVHHLGVQLSLSMEIMELRSKLDAAKLDAATSIRSAPPLSEEERSNYTRAIKSLESQLALARTASQAPSPSSDSIAQQDPVRSRNTLAERMGGFFGQS